MFKVLKKKKNIAIILGIALILTIGGSIFSKKAGNKNGEIMVDTIKLDKGQISSIIRVKGELKSKTRAEISSELKYKVKEIFVKEGDIVKQGDSLASLDVKDLSNDLKNAKLDLEISEEQYKEKMGDDNLLNLQKDLEGKEIDLEVARNKYNSSKELYESGNLSKEEFDADSINLKKLENGIAVAKQSLNSAIKKKNNGSDLKMLEQKRLNYENKLKDESKTVIKSSINGTVTAVNAKIGSIADASTTGLFVIEDLKNLQAKFDVNEFDVEKLHIGDEISLTTESILDKKFKGKIVNIFPTAVTKDSSSGKTIVIPVVVDLVGDVTGLRAGTVIESNVEVNKKKDVMVVPYEAIVEKQDKSNVVYVVKNGIVKEVKISLGVQGDSGAQIISKDLKIGDEILSKPDEKTYDGMKVKTNTSSNGKKGK